MLAVVPVRVARDDRGGAAIVIDELLVGEPGDLAMQPPVRVLHALDDLAGGPAGRRARRPRVDRVLVLVEVDWLARIR